MTDRPQIHCPDCRSPILIMGHPCDACGASTRPVDFDTSITVARQEIEWLRALLREHHQHHLQAGPIGLPDGKGGWVEIDNGAEYSDSALYERTEAALSEKRDGEADG